MVEDMKHILCYVKCLCLHSNSCSTTECVNGDCSYEIEQESLSVVNQEPDDVCSVMCIICYLSQ